MSRDLVSKNVLRGITLTARQHYSIDLFVENIVAEVIKRALPGQVYSNITNPFRTLLVGPRLIKLYVNAVSENKLLNILYNSDRCINK